ncbi:dCTP deaminase [archaeon]|nr:dCTP deaminase [archaeon]
MILSDKEILKQIKAKKIGIEPFEEKFVSACGMDIRLGYELRGFKNNVSRDFFNPFEKIEADDYTELIKPEHGRFILEPGKFVLATSLERVKICDGIAGRLEGRSSIGRLGIILNVGHIAPGFDGRLTLNLCNISAMPIALYPEMRIGQVLFERMTSEPSLPYSKRKNSKYSGEKGPVVSRIYRDMLNGRRACHG